MIQPLIRRELRGVVRLLLILAGTTFVVFSAGRWLSQDLDPTAKGLVFRFLEPVWALFAAVLLVDKVIVREAGSRGRKMLAKLPVSMGSVFAAKLIAALGSLLVLLGAILIAGFCSDVLFGGDRKTFVAPHDRVASMVLLSIAISTTFLAGTLVPKSVGAFAGALGLGFGAYAGAFLVWGKWLADFEVTRSEFQESLNATGVLFALACLSSSACTFIRGAIHRRAPLRVLVCALTGFLLIALPPSVVGLIRLDKELSFPEVHEITSVHVNFAEKTDFGTWIGVGIMKGEQLTAYYTLKNLDDGRVIRLGRGRLPGHPHPISGTVPIYEAIESTSNRSSRNGLKSIGEIDLRTGEFRMMDATSKDHSFGRVRELTHHLSDGRRFLVRSARGMALEHFATDNSLVRRQDIPGSHQFGCTGREVITTNTLPTRQDPLHLIAVDLRTGAERQLDLPGLDPHRIGASGTIAIADTPIVYWLAENNHSLRAIDINTGLWKEVAAFTEETAPGTIGVSPGGRWLILTGKTGTSVFDSELNSFQNLPEQIALHPFLTRSAFAPDDLWAAGFGYDSKKTLVTWVINFPAIECSTIAAGIHDIGSSPWLSGEQLIITSGNKVLLHSVSSGEAIVVFP